MGSLVSKGKAQIRYFQSNYPKLVLKNYAKICDLVFHIL